MGDYALTLTDAEIARYRRMAEDAEQAERGQWIAAGAVPGARIADVGCGPGAVAVRLAALAAPDGRVWALDRDRDALRVARALADDSGVEITTEERPADATGLPEGTFDLVMLRHVLAHNGGSEQAIVDHLATLVRPGGSVYLVDVDIARTGFRAPVDPSIEELLDRYQELHRRRGNDLRVGARLDQLLTAAGLDLAHFQGRVDVAHPPPHVRGPAWAARDTLVAEGLATSDDVAHWDRAFAGLKQPTTFFATSFAAYARKPTANG
jgi:SAM-dependent methyltransferase